MLEKAEIFLRSIKKEDSRYGEALRALARLGTVEWAESLKEKGEYTEEIKKKKIKSTKEFYEIYIKITQTGGV